VSVGTLYQYFPNKQALLYALLQRHADSVVAEVEDACNSASGASLDVIVDKVVDALIRVKTERVDESKLLYVVAEDLGGSEILAKSSLRMRSAVAGTLAAASDAHFDDHALVAFFFLSALVGPIRNVLERESPSQLIADLPQQLQVLGLAYLQAVRTCP